MGTARGCQLLGPHCSSQSRGGPGERSRAAVSTSLQVHTTQARELKNTSHFRLTDEGQRHDTPADVTAPPEPSGLPSLHVSWTPAATNDLRGRRGHSDLFGHSPPWRPESCCPRGPPGAAARVPGAGVTCGNASVSGNASAGARAPTSPGRACRGGGTSLLSAPHSPQSAAGVPRPRWTRSPPPPPPRCALSPRAPPHTWRSRAQSAQGEGPRFAQASARSLRENGAPQMRIPDQGEFYFTNGRMEARRRRRPRHLQVPEISVRASAHVLIAHVLAGNSPGGHMHRRHRSRKGTHATSDLSHGLAAAQQTHCNIDWHQPVNRITGTM